MSDVGKLLKNRRAELKLSQEYVGKVVGVSAATVSRWESGQIANMTRSRIADLAKVLQISPMDIIDFDPDFEPNDGTIPLIGRIACGAPVLAEENIEEYIALPSGVRADYALTCRGDSMIGAGIHDGDTVFIRQTSHVENGRIAAVLIGEEATLKHLYHTDSGIFLGSDNPAVAPIILNGKDAENARVLGVAVAYLHKIL